MDIINSSHMEEKNAITEKHLSIEAITYNSAAGLLPPAFFVGSALGGLLCICSRVAVLTTAARNVMSNSIPTSHRRRSRFRLCFPSFSFTILALLA